MKKIIALSLMSVLLTSSSLVHSYAPTTFKYSIPTSVLKSLVTSTPVKATPTPIKATPTPIRRIVAPLKPNPTPIKATPTPTPIPINLFPENYDYDVRELTHTDFDKNYSTGSNHLFISIKGDYENVWVKLPGVTGWLDASKYYPGAGTPTKDGEPCRDGGTTPDKVHVTFGANNTILSGNQVQLKFKLLNGQSIQNVQIHEKEPVNTTFTRDNYSESNRYTFEGMLMEKMRTLSFDQLLKVAEHMFGL